MRKFDCNKIVVYKKRVLIDLVVLKMVGRGGVARYFKQIFGVTKEKRLGTTGLKGRIANIFNQVFVGGVGDTAWRGHNSTVIEDVTGRLDVHRHAVFIINQSHSAVVSVKAGVSCAQAVKLHP